MPEEIKTGSFDELIMKTGRKMAGCFEENNYGFVDALIITSGTRHFMVWLYRHMVAKKRISAIESLDINLKKEMWSFVKDVCRGKANDVAIMKEVAMAFQAIEYFINEKK